MRGRFYHAPSPVVLPVLASFGRWQPGGDASYGSLIEVEVPRP